MIIKEYISDSNKRQMISTLLKHYKVESVKVREKSMKTHANYNVDNGVLELSTKYKTIKNNQIEEFIITLLHEIYHAMDAKRLGWKGFKLDYEWEQNYQVSNDKDPYKDNKFEIEAEAFGQSKWKKWKDKFKKSGLL
jgi:hypothetical protein